MMILLLLLMTSTVLAQQPGLIEGRSLYDALKKFELRGKVSVSNLTLTRDRAEMVFTGDFYFAAPINGRITGAVFIGEGLFSAAPPAEVPFEQENLMRFLNDEIAESNFKTAVLRFNDDTFDIIGKGMNASAAIPGEAVSLATGLDPRLMEETGANISSRLLVSLANTESPGFFLAQFDKGRRSRFTFILDPQTRIPAYPFGITGGEKLMLFTYTPYINDIWMAAYAEEDFKKKTVEFSDVYDLVAPLHYKMDLDVRNARKSVPAKMRIDFESLVDNLRVVPMRLNEGITEYDNTRKDHSMRLKWVKYEGQETTFVQEPWEVGLAVTLPKPIMKGDKFSLELFLEGDIISKQQFYENIFMLQSATNWYPRHGYLKRATYDITFRHQSHDHVASIGKLVRDSEPWPDEKSDRLTQFKMDQPVTAITFTGGILERKTEKPSDRPKDKYKLTADKSVDLFSLPAAAAVLKESFMLQEMRNCLEYFSASFGPYPFEYLRGIVVGGGVVPSLIAVPPSDKANRAMFEAFGHGISYQWWGNLVSWRSQREQWLSEGLAQYSGLLYVAFRYNLDAQRDIIKEAREYLPYPPRGNKGVLAGKVAEIGPLILGHRLATRNTSNAYGQLIVAKSQLVMRMLHFLFTDPSTGEGQPFFTMLTDFVKQYQGKAATTEDFQRVASENFVNTPIAKNLRMKNLDWFFQQWVYEARLPSYRLEYTIEPGQNGQFTLNWTVMQDNAGSNWVMPLPVVLKFPGGKKANTVVYVKGLKTSSKITLPAMPSSVELDPDYWILTEKTITKKM
jgi:hypothetical protein